MASDRDVADGIVHTIQQIFRDQKWGGDNIPTRVWWPCRDAIEAALAKAREEGRLAGMEEALSAFPDPDPDSYSLWAPSAIRAAIRARQTPTGTGETK